MIIYRRLIFYGSTVYLICAYAGWRAGLHVLAPVLEVKVSHGAFFGGRLVQRLVTYVVYQLRLVVPERDADVIRVAKRQVRTTTTSEQQQLTVNFYGRGNIFTRCSIHDTGSKGS